MRAAASSVTAILILAMLFAVGGAVSPVSGGGTVEVQLAATDAAVFGGGPPSFTTSSTVPQLPPGCAPPRRDSACAITVVAGGLDVPVTARDLVPTEVQSVDDWRPVVERFFQPDDVDRALRIIECESGGDPEARNPRSTATGLFQHLASLWPRRSTRAGWPGAEITDPVANTAVAAWLVYHGGGWSHWSPSSHCW